MTQSVKWDDKSTYLVGLLEDGKSIFKVFGTSCKHFGVKLHIILREATVVMG